MDERHTRAIRLDKILLTLILGTCTGIVIDVYTHSAATMVTSIVAALSFWSAIVLFQKRKELFILGLVFSFAVFFGFGRAELARPDETLFVDSVGSGITLEGIIADEPVQKAYGQNFTLDIGKMNVLVSSELEPELEYGDKVSVTGLLEKPANFMTDQGTEFDYISYLYKDNILYRLKNAKAAVISSGHGNLIVANLIPFKNWVLHGFYRVFPAPEANLLAGLNLGEKSSIEPDFRNDLVTTGTIHIIALSGYNVSIIASSLRDFFTDILGLMPRVAQISGAVCIIVFVTMTGLQSSAIRAGIMALIALFARGAGRTYVAFRALLAAGFLMILWNPKYLVYDVSFQLSFLATLGIIFITPVLERTFVRVPKKFLRIIPLREALAVTLGAQIGVYPFILYKMGTLSLISLPANILVLPVIPYAMGFGLLSGLIGNLSVGLAYPITFLTHLLLKYITGLITFFAKVPFAAIVFKHFPLMLCLLLYGVVGTWLFCVWKRAKQNPA